jgi:sugar O-acyltransferase (sialic acid O-acetyltransferase NeuD family)
MSELVVLGTSGHARSCLDVIATSDWKVRGCVGSPPAGDLQANYLGDDGVLRELIASGVGHAVVAVGDNQARRRLIGEVSDLGFQLPSVVSRFAVVSPTASLGDGCVVMHGVVIGPYATLGTGVIVNTGATVDHDCRVEDYTHVAPGTHLAGTVSIRSGALVGVGASVAPGVVIGAWAVVGAGAAVIGDVQAGQTVAGVPARELSSTR